ncbi:SDR family NAD(P)-dependent oxidoreductase [Filimonas effusa]|nr:SDR family NAD(P)-dependent oxidoreductase [Filimonas effusa]
MKRLQFKNKWVMVTGASSGLGQEISRQLAFNHQANLIIVARREEKLTALKHELEQGAGIQVKTIAADLSNAADIERVLQESLTSNALYGAILNAGVTYFGRHTALSWQQFEAILQTNVVGVVRMTNGLVAHFEQSGREGGLMLVSSMAAIYPAPYQAAYSASKAFILSFGNALSHELQNKDFSITVYAPGGIATEMTAAEQFGELKSWLMPVKQAAREAIYAFAHRKYNYIPGFTNRLGSRFMALLPKKFIAGKMGVIYLKSLMKMDGR